MTLNPLKTWTATLFRTWWPHMTFRSVLRCRDYLLGLNRGHPADHRVRLEVTAPFSAEVVLRSVDSDWFTFKEIVLEEVYGDILKHVPDSASVIDLGANIGLASLYFAAKYPKSRVCAVEPSDANYELLVDNLHPLIDSGRCRALHAALWEREALLGANPLPAPERHNSFSVRELTPGEDGGAWTIKGMPMGAVIDWAGFTHVDVLKVDIEGAERQLFSGDLNWLSRVRALMVEFHDDARRESAFDAIMLRHGFQIREENRHTVLAVKAA
jgi:FkbM family methyltransferase